MHMEKHFLVSDSRSLLEWFFVLFLFFVVCFIGLVLSKATHWGGFFLCVKMRVFWGKRKEDVYCKRQFFLLAMKFSLVQAVQWVGAALVILVLVGLNWDFESEAGMRLNSSVDDSLSQGIRGYWKLDDGTGTNATDSSGNGNTLAMTGSPSWATGQIGPSALDFSGTGQYLSVADPVSGVLDFAAGASFTLTGWFNRDTFAADHTIIAKKTNRPPAK